MNRGYIRLWRKSLDAGWIKNHKLWTFWTYCLLKASYKEFDAIIGLQVVHLMPGQFIFGRTKAVKETGLTEREIRTILAFLIKAGNLTVKTTNKFSIITIINWPTYQGDISENDRLNDQPPTSKGPHTSIKEVKTFLSDSIEIRLSEFLLDKILSRNPKHKRPNLQAWARDIDRMIRIDKRTPEEIRAMIESIWSQTDTFWQNNILSTAKLRKQYDRLKLKMGNESERIILASPPVPPLKCPRCGRELAAKSYFYGEGCTFCERSIEVSS